MLKLVSIQPVQAQDKPYGSGEALYFNGEGDRFALGSVTSDDGYYSRRTYEMWFKPDEVSAGSGLQILFKAGADANGFTFFLHNETLYGGAWEGEGQVWLAIPVDGEEISGSWHHFAMVFDGPSGELRGYFDGEVHTQEIQDWGGLPRVSSHEALDAIANVSDDRLLPRFGPAEVTDEEADDPGFAGEVDQFRLWDRAIATQEIWELSRKTLEDPEAEAENNDLRLALRFDGTEEDASGNVENITELWDMGYKSQPVDEFQFGPVAPYPYRYSGYQKDADWRVEAEERIEDHRMADVEVSVVDGQGNPIEGAGVDVQMQQHKFNFGTAVNSYPLFNEQGYADKLQENFNYATIENELKVYRWEGNQGTQEAVRDMVEWLNEHDFGIRGHAAFWERWGWMNMDPEDEISQNDTHDYREMTDEEIHETMKSKIKDRVGEFSGRITDWDVQNHPFHRIAIRDHLGGRDPYVLEWWEAAHEADPHANMGINEQNIIQKYWEPGWTDEYDAWIEWLIENEAGVEGIGFMAHGHINRLEGIPTVLERFDRFGEYNIPLYISEFHVEIESDSWPRSSWRERDAQNAYTRDFVTAAFSHPDVETLVYWNFWAGAAWRENSVFYSKNWELRDHGRMWRELIYNKWWTEKEGSTDKDGLYTTSGFTGDYLITASEGDASVSKQIVLDEDKSVEIVID